MKKYVIAGFSGIGKTTLGNKNKKDVLDMEVRPYKYANYKNEYTLKQWYEMEHILNEDYLPKYIDAVKKEIETGTHKIIFIWLTIEVLEYLRNENIEFIVVTWNNKEEGIKEFLVDRYTQRGNPPYWIKKNIEYLNVIDNYVEQNKIKTIVLNKNENIESKLKELNLLS